MCSPCKQAAGRLPGQGSPEHTSQLVGQGDVDGVHCVTGYVACLKVRDPSPMNFSGSSSSSNILSRNFFTREFF